MPSLSVVIVNYNTGEYLKRCLDSLVEHLANEDWEGIVVDNASIDGSEKVVSAFAPRVSLLRNEANLGFGRAVNQGMRATTAAMALFVNPDARLLPGALDRMRAELNARPEYAIVGPAVLDEDGRPQGSARGDPDMWTGLFGRSSWLTRLFPRSRPALRNVRSHEARTGGDAAVDVDWVSGACMLVRRGVFERMNGFDERFFMYWEDADLCRRIRDAGFVVRYRPDAHVVHTAGRSSATARRLAIRAFHRSAYLYYSSHVARSPFHPARWVAFVALRLRCLMMVRLAGRGSGGAPRPQTSGADQSR